MVGFCEVNGCKKIFWCRLTRPGVSWIVMTRTSAYFCVTGNRECLFAVIVGFFWFTLRLCSFIFFCGSKNHMFNWTFQHYFCWRLRRFTQIVLVSVPLSILDCIVCWGLWRFIDKLYFWIFSCLGKSITIQVIGCNPFSGRLTHSTRQMREHKTVSPNYRHLSTSTILCIEKIWFEKVFKLTGCFCVFCCSKKKKKKMTLGLLSRSFWNKDGSLYLVLYLTKILSNQIV